MATDQQLLRPVPPRPEEDPPVQITTENRRAITTEDRKQLTTG